MIVSGNITVISSPLPKSCNFSDRNENYGVYTPIRPDSVLHVLIGMQITSTYVTTNWKTKTKSLTVADLSYRFSLRIST